MRRIRLENIEAGMTVARPILNSDGRVLLAEGMILTDSYIRRLFESGIASVYIQDPRFGTIENIPEPVSERTRIESLKTVKEGFDSLSQKKRMNTRAFKKVVENLLDELLCNRNVLHNVADIRAYDDYTYAHSLNVAILSIMAGIKMQYTPSKLHDLGLGALLHDVGKIMIEKEIVNKPGDLTPREYDKMKNHALYGFEIMRQYDDISLLSAHISYQHHERFDGKGYPRGLANRGIHEYAGLVAVADVFDALTADRPYRQAYSVVDATDYIRRMAQICFHEEHVQAFSANIALYPVGSVVRLNTNEVGIVTYIDPNHSSTPTVRVLYDSNLERLPAPAHVDLRNYPNLYVLEVFSAERIIEVFHHPMAEQVV